MIAKKPSKATRKRIDPAKLGKLFDWRESLRRRLSKIPEIEGIFAVATAGVIHVFTVIADHKSEIYEPLMKQESLVEKDHPSVAFDFHTREHQGRPPHR